MDSQIPRSWAVILLCTALIVGADQTCSKSDPGIAACSQQPWCGKQRIRREISDMTDEQWNKVVSAMWVMKNTTRADGLSKYGGAFRTWDHIVVKHAVAGRDSRGEQAHLSDAFITFHSVLALEVENSLLAIDSTIEGLPYWDVGRVDGAKRGFNKESLGSAPGTGPHNQVIDGSFANWPINPKFDMSEIHGLRNLPPVVQPFQGHPSGMLRCDYPANPLIAPYVVRYGGHGTDASNPKEWSFSAADQLACANRAGCWGDWQACIDALPGAIDFHTGFHKVIGGQKKITTAVGEAVHGPVSGTVALLGDLEDPCTSPNDPAFFFHHANIDRNRLDWMKNRDVADPSMKAGYYGYKGSQEGGKCYGAPWYRGPAKEKPANWTHYLAECILKDGPLGPDMSIPACKKACAKGYTDGFVENGIDLGDTVNALFPFTNDDLQLPGLAGRPADGITHAEVICHIGPDTAPYTYVAPGDTGPTRTANPCEGSELPDATTADIPEAPPVTEAPEGGNDDGNDADSGTFSWEVSYPSCTRGYWDSGCGQPAMEQTGTVKCYGMSADNKWVAADEMCTDARPAATRTCPATEPCPRCQGCKRNGNCWKTCGKKAGRCSKCDSLDGRKGVCCQPGNENNPTECLIAEFQFNNDDIHTCALLPEDEHMGSVLTAIMSRLSKLEKWVREMMN